MSKFNYNQPVKEKVKEDEIVETPKVITGVVIDCAKLNVRKLPFTSSDVMCVIKMGDKVVINEEGSTDLFYKVCTAAGVDGYCMRKYIEVR